MSNRRAAGRVAVACAVALAAAGCGTPYSGLIAGALGVAYLGSRPSNDLEQTYYLGVFDPQEQVPPTIYRVTVRGQASALNRMRFASGWVPARAIDSLGSRIDLDTKSGEVKLQDAAGQEVAALKIGRRLMMFGPEGFREAPADHRLAIVMGSDADEFFGMVDQALGAVAGVEADQQGGELHRKLFEALRDVKEQRERIGALDSDVKVELGAKGGA